MLSMTRNLARQFRAAMRRARLGKISSHRDASIHFAAGPKGLRIREASPGVGIEYRLAGAVNDEESWLPIDLLEAVEGRSNDFVTLESDDKYCVRLSWSDRGVPQLVSRMVEPPKDPLWLELPTEFTPNPPQLWTALRGRHDGRPGTSALRLGYGAAPWLAWPSRCHGR